MNFGFLGIIATIIVFGSMGAYNVKKEKALKTAVIQLAASFFGVVLFGFMLEKIYEVPVYKTHIDIANVGSISPLSESFDVTIIRNYDRQDKPSLPYNNRPYKDLFPKKGAGVNLSGIAKVDTPYVEHTNHRGSVLDKILEPVSHMLDTIDFKWGGGTSLVYTSITTSYRQTFWPSYNWPYIHSEKPYCQYFFNGKEGKWVYFNKDSHFLYHAIKEDDNGNGVIAESYSFVSKNDTILPFENNLWTKAHGAPTLLTAEDVSKIFEIIEIGDKEKLYFSTYALNSLTIDYIAPAEFSEIITPEPDEKTISSIRYTDKNKLGQIAKDGLRFHVKFPDMENIQNIRIFMLTALLTGLAAILFRSLFIIGYHLWNQYKNNSQIRKLTIIMLIILIILLVLILWDSCVNPYELENGILR